MLRFRVGYHIEDYNGEAAESGFTVVGVDNIQNLESFVIQCESIFAGLTDGRIVSALAFAKMPPYVEKYITGLAKSTERLLCLYTNGARYGSFLVPAARSFPTDESGPYARHRLGISSPDFQNYVVQLGELLSTTLLADGTPFPYGSGIRAAYTNYKEKP